MEQQCCTTLPAPTNYGWEMVDDNVASSPNSSYQSGQVWVYSLSVPPGKLRRESLLNFPGATNRCKFRQNGLSLTDLCGYCETDECQDTADIFLSDGESAIDDTEL